MKFNTFGWTEKEVEAGTPVYEALVEDNGHDVATFAAMIAAGKGSLAESRSRIVPEGATKLAFAKELVPTKQVVFSNTIDFEAFAPGTWNGMAFKRSDLEEISRNFKALEPYHKVPLKLGHNTTQPVTDGQPALGWVTKAWVDGDGKLMLRAADVPDVVKKAIQKKLYRKVSVELDIDVEHKGKKYSYVLSAVALLGADIPAVNTLADLDHYIGQSALAASRRNVFSAISGDIQSTEGGDMDPKDIQAMIDKAVKPLSEQTAQLSAENERLKAENAKFAREKDDAVARENAGKVAEARAKLTGLMEAAVKQNIITPAQRQMFTKSFGIEDDKRVMEIDAKDFETMICGGKKIVMSQASTAATGNTAPTRKYEEADDEIDYRVNAEQMKSGGKLAYGRALEMVLKSDPELAAEYLGSHG